jgi:inner membrane protein
MGAVPPGTHPRFPGTIMPSLLGHAVAGLAITSTFRSERLPRRTWVLAVVCATAPDLDWFVSLVGLHRGHALNHRGAFHSLFAALLIGAAVYILGYPRELRRAGLWLCLTLAALSHGLLDACTVGGVGVALFMPFSDTRWACLWQPGWVPPLPLGRSSGLTFLWSLANEAVWIGMPAVLLAAVSRLVRQIGARPVLSEAVPENP